MGMLVTLMSTKRGDRGRPHRHVTIPQGWYERIEGQGFRTDKLEMEMRDDEIILRAIPLSERRAPDGGV